MTKNARTAENRCISMETNAAAYFNEAYMQSFFDLKLRKKQGGGRDHLTPEKFYAKYGNEFGKIASQCLDGTYRFSYYNEKLVSKGSGKYPRVLSIPSIRDRLVLGVLNDYLSIEFPDCVQRIVPNRLMANVVDMMSSAEGDIYFLRTDFHDFYGSISIKMLENMLSSKIKDENIKELIRKAVTTQTISGHKPCRSNRKPKYGIPQGLAISNILASIYMKSFDEEFGSNYADSYIRYVDDILFLNLGKPIYKRPMLKELQRRNLRLRLSPEKCKQGIVGKDRIEFLGYVIKSKDKVFVREKNITKFLSRIAALAARCKEGLDKPHVRPIFIKEDSAYIEYYIEEFNQVISGFKYEHIPYGWIAYFQTITDVASLYGMDRVIHRRILKELPTPITSKINRLVDTYYAIRRESGGSLVKDYDALTDTGSKRCLLLHRGWIREDWDYTDEQIEDIFQSYMNFIKKRELRNIGEIS